MNCKQSWCLDVNTSYVFDVGINITANFNEKYKLKYDDQPPLEAKIFLIFNMINYCLMTS